MSRLPRHAILPENWEDSDHDQSYSPSDPSEGSETENAMACEIKEDDEKFRKMRDEVAQRDKDRWDKLFEKYSDPKKLAKSDIVNMATGKIIEDNGHIRSLQQKDKGPIEERDLWGLGHPRIILPQDGPITGEGNGDCAFQSLEMADAGERDIQDDFEKSPMKRQKQSKKGFGVLVKGDQYKNLTIDMPEPSLKSSRLVFHFSDEVLASSDGANFITREQNDVDDYLEGGDDGAYYDDGVDEYGSDDNYEDGLATGVEEDEEPYEGFEVGVEEEEKEVKAENDADIRPEHLSSRFDHESREESEADDDLEDDLALVVHFDHTPDTKLYACSFFTCDFCTGDKQHLKQHLLAKHTPQLAQLGYPVPYTKPDSEPYFEIHDMVAWRLHRHFPLVWRLPTQAYVCNKDLKGRPCKKLFLTEEQLHQHRNGGSLCSAKRQVLYCPVLGCEYISEESYEAFLEHVSTHVDVRGIFPREPFYRISSSNDSNWEFMDEIELSPVEKEGEEGGVDGDEEEGYVEEGDNEPQDENSVEQKENEPNQIVPNRLLFPRLAARTGTLPNRIKLKTLPSKSVPVETPVYLGAINSSSLEMEPLDGLFSD